MGNPEKTSRRPKVGVRQVVELHRELNPHPGRSILVALDVATGQLFFCAATGLCVDRDEAIRLQRARDFS